MELEAVHVKDINGRTPLYHTVILPYDMELSALATWDSNRAKIATMLIEAGARVDVCDNYGKTPLDYAQENHKKLPKVYAVLKAAHKEKQEN